MSTVVEAILVLLVQANNQFSRHQHPYLVHSFVAIAIWQYVHSNAKAAIKCHVSSFTPFPTLTKRTNTITVSSIVHYLRSYVEDLLITLGKSRGLGGYCLASKQLAGLFSMKISAPSLRNQLMKPGVSMKRK
jgi:hypothetical protein